MSTARPKQKIIDSLKEVVQDLYDYLVAPCNKAKLIAILADVERQYNAPFESWIWGGIYYFYRLRSSDVESTKVELTKDCDHIRLLETMIHFFQKGGWEATSANTMFLVALLKELPQYELSPLSVESMQRLKELFIEKANFTIQDHKRNEEERLKKEEEIKAISAHRESIKQMQDLLSQKKEIKTEHEKPVGGKHFKETATLLEAFFLRKNVGKIKSEKPLAQIKPKKIQEDEKYLSTRITLNLLYRARGTERKLDPTVRNKNPGRLNQNENFLSARETLNAFFKSHPLQLNNQAMTKKLNVPIMDCKC